MLTFFVRWKVWPVWPDWAIYWTLRNFLMPLATIILPKSPTFLGNFSIGVKIYHFSSEINFRQLLYTFGQFFWSHWSQGWPITTYLLNKSKSNYGQLMLKRSGLGGYSRNFFVSYLTLFGCNGRLPFCLEICSQKFGHKNKSVIYW